MFFTSAALAQTVSSLPLGKPATEQPPALKEVRIDQNLNAQVPLDAAFRDETGRIVRLGDLFHGKPVVLTLNYYECPMLCTVILNAVVHAFRVLPFDAGREFEAVTISINPNETPQLAASKKQIYIQEYGRPGAAGGWHFLTGPERAIRAVADAVGFHYVYDPAIGQFAHAAGIMVLTPEGRVARYLYGIEFAPRDLKFALMEAAAHRIGSPVDQVLLFCYHYDSATGKYTSAVLTSVRAAGSVTVLLLVGFIAIKLRRERRKSRRLAS